MRDVPATKGVSVGNLGSCEVALVVMPYAPLERPAIGVSLLKAVLQSRGISCSVVYGNLIFAEQIGYDAYRWVEGTPSEYLLGEWTFAPSAFREDFRETEWYLDLVLAQHPALVTREPVRTSQDLERRKELVRDVRAAGSAFVRELGASIVQCGPRFIGCSSTFVQHCASLALLRRVKEIDHDMLTLLGGANCEGEMGVESLRCFDWVDAIVSGEGEEALLKLVEDVRRGRRLASVSAPGLLTRPAQAGAGDCDPPAIPAHSAPIMDTLPTPDYSDYFAALGRSPFKSQLRPGLLIEGSRGCWWGQRAHCTFCGLNGLSMTYRAKNPERIEEEFAYLTETWSTKGIAFVDNIIDMPILRRWATHVAARGAEVNVFLETKATLSRDDLDLLRLAGVTAVQPGIESLSDDALRLLKKGVTAIGNVEFLKWCRELGIDAYWNVLCGIPGECDQWCDEIATLLPLLHHLRPPMAMVRVRYDRFSPYHQMPQVYGLRLRPFRTYGAVYPLCEESLARLAYFFEDDCGEPRLNILQPATDAQRRLGDRIAEWRLVYFDANPPMLSYRWTDTGVEINDSRACRAAPSYSLQAEAAAVFQHCASARSIGSVVRSVIRDMGVVEDKVLGAIEFLAANGLILRSHGKLLSLACEEPVPAAPSFSDFPAGYAFPPDEEVAAREVAREVLAGGDGY